jgi:hypothetical protein
MQPNDQLKTFYQTMEGEGLQPLTPDNPYYVPILGDSPRKDPILRLWQRIDYAQSESVNLLTGFRGNGKSTELRRLKHLLEEQGSVVYLVNMLDYLLLTKPVELSDFILSLMAAFARELEQDTALDLQPLTSSYWERLTTFLKSDVGLDKAGVKISVPGGAIHLGMQLKTEPDFKKNIQTHLRGHLTRLVDDARQFIVAVVDAIRKKYNDPAKKVVLLVDSVEQIRGLGEDAPGVYTSVTELFSGQAANLAFPKFHIVYTVPPFLMAIAQNLGRNLGGHPVIQWPNIHVRDKTEDKPDQTGIRVMEEIIASRYAAWQTFFSREQINYLASISGGDLRDFFRLIKECLVSCSLDPAPEKRVNQEAIDLVVMELRNSMLPLADQDARWLAKIHTSKREELADTADLPDLARYLDTNLIMNYLNGEPWYDIHPVLIDEIRARGFFDETEGEQ